MSSSIVRTQNGMVRIIWSVIILLILLLAIPSFQSSATDGRSSDFPKTNSRTPDQGIWSMNYTVSDMGSGTNTPSIISSDGTIHCVFSNDGIYYSRSLDNGATWEYPKEISSQGTIAGLTPAISAEGSDVYILWNQETGGPLTHKLYFVKSNDTGKTFSDPVLFSGMSGHWTTDQKIISVNGTIYTVWTDDRDDPSRANEELYFRRSDDKGVSWTTEKRLTFVSWPSWHPVFGVERDTIHIIFEDERLGGTHRIYYMRSPDKGASWISDTMISDPGIFVIEPWLSVQGLTLHAVWSMPPDTIIYRKSTDGGLSWKTIRTIKGGDGVDRHEPYIKAYGSFVQVIWNQESDLAYINSTDGGSTFGQVDIVGSNINLVGYERGYQTLDVDLNGSYLAYCSGNSEIKYRFKGLLPDLTVLPTDLVFGLPYGFDGKTYIDLNMTIHNIGPKAITSGIVEIYLNQLGPTGLVEEYQLGPLAGGAQTTVRVPLEMNITDNIAYVNIKNAIPMEADLTNNQASASFKVSNFPPFAKFSANRINAMTGDLIEFNVSTSYDTDGSVTDFLLELGDGRSLGWKSMTEDSNVWFSYSDEGDYLVNLTVKDDKGALSEIVNISIHIINRAPNVEISILTDNLNRKSLFPINFSSNGSYDPDGNIKSYFWDFGDHTNASTQNATHVYSNSGYYEVMLRLTDDNNATNETTQLIEILNLPPIGVITLGHGNGIYHKGESVEFLSSGTYDPDGLVQSMAWNFGDGDTKIGTNVSHKFRSFGTFNVTLIVTDNDGSATTVRLIIDIINIAPEVSVVANKTTVVSLNPVKFWSNASDKDGTIVAFHWDFSDGNTSISPNPEHVFGRPGKYLVMLTVTDDADATVNTSIEVWVLNRDPSAHIWANNTLVYQNDMIMFSASGSTDVDGLITSYEWLLPDGSLHKNMTLNTSFSNPGNYTVRLGVVDDKGATAYAEIKIEVRKRPVIDEHQDNGWSRLIVYISLILVVVIILIIVGYTILRPKRRSSRRKKGYKPKPDHEDPDEGDGAR